MHNSLSIEQKTVYLQQLGTAELIRSINSAQAEFEKALTEEAEKRLEYSQHLTGRSTTSPAVKQIETELMIQAPAKNAEGKKSTAADKEAWLQEQREANPALKEAIEKEKMAGRVLSDLAVILEIAKSRLSNLKAILALRTAQITFFASDITISVKDTDIENQKKQQGEKL